MIGATNVQGRGRRIDAAAMRAIVNEQLMTLRREFVARAESDRRVMAARSLAELWHVVDQHPEHRDIYSRALVDQVTANNPGVMGSNLLRDVKGIVQSRRPAISAFGREPLGGAGMSVDWPYYTGNLSAVVGEQVTQKSEITTVRVDLLKGTSAIQTFAGGSDVSLQTIRRSDPSWLDEYQRILLSAYALVTDAAFIDALEAAATGAVALTWATATEGDIHGALANASVQVQSKTGLPATFGIAAPGVYTVLIARVKPSYATSGTEAGTLAPIVSGLRIYQSAAVNTNSLIVSNNQAAAWHEDGPFQIADDDVARLGQNIAVWGMGAAAIYGPAAIVEVGA
jgi:hypothetical protein